MGLNNIIHSNSFQNDTIINNSVLSSSDTDVLNPSDDLFLHPLDNPNNMLVNDLLNGKNYGTWKKSMEIALIAKNKLGFVLGTCSNPDISSPPLY